MKKLLFIPLLFLSLIVSSQNYYGTPYGSDGLSNIKVGYNTNVSLSYRFLCDYTGDVEAIGVYLITYLSGYAGGDGGILRVSLQADDGTANHHPTGVVLGSYTDNSPLHWTIGGTIKYTLDSPVALDSGTLYHIVFDNLDADPTVNYVSADMLIINNPPGTWADLSPTVSNDNLATLWSHGAVVYEKLNYMPIYTLFYDDAHESGIGYYGSGITLYTKNIDGNEKVRSLITVSGTDKTIQKVWVRVKKITGTDDLTIRLQKSDGTLMEEGTVSADLINSYMTWVSYTFDEAPVIENTKTYHLILSTPATSTYRTYPLYDASVSFPGTLVSMFTDGRMQHTSDGVSWSNTFGTEGDLEMYFEYTDAAPPIDPIVITTTRPYWTSSTTAVSGGDVTSSGGGTVSQKGVCWNTTGTPTTADSKTEEGAGTGVFSSTLTGLTRGLVYYVRAYATNETGTSYGEELTFVAKFLNNGNKILFRNSNNKILFID